MTLSAKRALVAAVLIVGGFCLGRLVVRALGNLLLGGTLFGGDFL